jgi:hypothetical protein
MPAPINEGFRKPLASITDKPWNMSASALVESSSSPAAVQHHIRPSNAHGTGVNGAAVIPTPAAPASTCSGQQLGFLRNHAALAQDAWAQHPQHHQLMVQVRAPASSGARPMPDFCKLQQTISSYIFILCFNWASACLFMVASLRGFALLRMHMSHTRSLCSFLQSLRCLDRPTFISIQACVAHRLGACFVGIIGTTPSDTYVLQVLMDGVSGPESRAIVPVAGTDTIAELKMTLSKKSWFTSKHCLFFGDRELLDHQQVADIISAVHASGNNSYLHVFVRTQDVRFGKLSTAKTSLSFGSLAHLEQDADIASTQDPKCNPISLDSPGSIATSAGSKDITTVANDSTVIHIVIRKTAHVTWKPTADGTFELVVKSSDTAAQVKQHLLPSNSPACPNILEDVSLLHNGIHMEADRPLLEYGLNDGDVLELVPWEPIISKKPKQSSATESDMDLPTLSSPAHELYMNWQKAASGLRAGVDLQALFS